MAHILESVEIRRLFPMYNKSQKGYLPQYGLYVYEDRMGYNHLAIARIKTNQQPLVTFNTLVEGQQKLRALIDQFELCPRLCHLVKTSNCEELIPLGICMGHCKTIAKEYNEKVQEALVEMSHQLPSFVYIDKGIQMHQRSCILMKQGQVYGMGYIDHAVEISNLTTIEEALEPLPNNDYIRNLVLKHAVLNPEKCLSFD